LLGEEEEGFLGVDGVFWEDLAVEGGFGEFAEFMEFTEFVELVELREVGRFREVAGVFGVFGVLGVEGNRLVAGLYGLSESVFLNLIN
jgi:hypothetical protein